MAGENPVIIGHRGYPLRYPENTIASFLAAILYGADGVELDVWLSGDGTPVVIHDSTTRRVSDRDLDVKKTNLSELRQVYLGMGQTIPTLEEVLKTTPPGKYLFIELKDIDAVEPVLNLVKRYGRVQETLVISFIKEALVKIRELDSEIKIGLNIDSFDKLQWGLNKKTELNIYSLNPPVEGLRLYKHMLGWIASQVKTLGLRIYVWTVNDPREALELTSYVDGIITDNVEEIVRELKKTTG